MRLYRGVVVVIAVALLGIVVSSGIAQKAAHRTQKKSSSSTSKATKPQPSQDSTKLVSHSAVIEKHDSVAVVRASPKPEFSWRHLHNGAFAVGEKLTFEVDYGFINAGTAVMCVPSYENVNGRTCYRVEFNVDSHPSFNWVFKVEDRYRTFIDSESLASQKFEQHIREGGYKHDFIAEFDQVKHIAHTFPRDFPIPPYVHDIMSAFYYYRTLDLSGAKEGDILTLNNFYDDATYELGVKVLGRQQLDISAGSFNTIVVEPLIKEGGLFKSEGRIVIWLSDDDLKVPLRVNTKVVIGSIDTELKEYSGLAGSLRARIK